MSRKPKEPGFEDTLAELETLVARMEAGSLPLDEALRNFERGVQLTRECQAALQQAQQRVQMLTELRSDAALQDFTAPGAGTEP
ncbi:MAG: exodeoxyribonuclease VII small subunit [Steroidobacteraceae bacterium]